MDSNFIPSAGTIEIYSSNGKYNVDVVTGKIISKQLNDDAPVHYKRIYRFDLKEAKTNGVNSLDILNFGYWYTGREGERLQYETPVLDWRELVLEINHVTK